MIYLRMQILLAELKHVHFLLTDFHFLHVAAILQNSIPTGLDPIFISLSFIFPLLSLQRFCFSCFHVLFLVFIPIPWSSSPMIPPCNMSSLLSTYYTLNKIRILNNYSIIIIKFLNKKKRKGTKKKAIR
jgi:hypothetical protein